MTKQKDFPLKDIEEFSTQVEKLLGALNQSLLSAKADGATQIEFSSASYSLDKISQK